MDANKPAGFTEPWDSLLRAFIVDQKAAVTEKTLSSSMVPMGSSVRSIGTSMRSIATAPLAGLLAAPPNQGVLARQHSAAPSGFAQFLGDVEQIGAGITFGLQRVSQTLEPVLACLRNPSPETIEAIKALLIGALLYEKYNRDHNAIFRAIAEARLGCKADALLVTKIPDACSKPISGFLPW